MKRRRDTRPFTIPAHVWWPSGDEDYDQWRARWMQWWRAMPDQGRGLDVRTPTGEPFTNTLLGLLAHMRVVRRTLGLTTSSRINEHGHYPNEAEPSNNTRGTKAE